MNKDENGSVLRYQKADGTTRIKVAQKDESMWPNLGLMAEYF